MTKKQALALLSLIADLYSIANMPDPPASATNGQGQADREQAHPMTVSD